MAAFVVRHRPQWMHCRQMVRSAQRRESLASSIRWYPLVASSCRPRTASGPQRLFRRPGALMLKTAAFLSAWRGERRRSSLRFSSHRSVQRLFPKRSGLAWVRSKGARVRWDFGDARVERLTSHVAALTNSHQLVVLQKKNERRRCRRPRKVCGMAREVFDR